MTLLGLLKYWSQIVSAIGGAAIMYFVLSWSYGLEIDILKAKDIRDTNNAIVDQQKVCAAKQEITRKTDETLQTKLNTLAAARDAALAKLRTTNQCVKVTRPASKNDGASTAPELWSGTQLPASFLIEQAYWADENTTKLDSCQQFIRDTWKLNGQTID